MAFWNKGNFTYEFSQVHNIFEEEITSANDLIYFLTEENQRLLDEDDNGSVVITKIKASKKGESIIFAKKVSLPIKNKGYAYFQDELKAFYATKPVAYEPINEEEVFEESPELPENNLDDEGEGFAPVPDIASLVDYDDKTEEVAEAKNIIPQPQAEEGSSLSMDELIAQKVAEALAEQTAQKDEEIERLDQAISQLKQAEAKAKAPEQGIEETTGFQDYPSEGEPYSLVDEEKTENKVEQDVAETPKEQGVSSESSLTNPDFVVAETLQLLKEDMEKKLQEFVSQERAKIDEEIKALDQREGITPRLTQLNAQEKTKAIEQEKIRLNKAEENSRQDELRRHEAELEVIKQTYETQRSEAENKIHGQFEDKLRQEIQAEYTRQSKQLERIFQGKLDELQLHQKDMTEGLKANFAQVLEQFNAGHSQVIHDVEAQKNSNVVNFPSKTAS